MALLQSQSIDERVLVKVFETYWPQFEAEFKRIVKSVAPEEEPKKRTEQSLLAEILDNTRGLNIRVRQLEARIEDTTIAAIRNRTAAERMVELAQNTTMAEYARERADALSAIGNKELASASRQKLMRFREQMREDNVPNRGAGDT